MGLYKFRKELIEKLINLNYDIYISLPYDEYFSQLQELGCECIETDFNRRGKNPINDIKLFINYIKLIKKIKPDVVFTYTIKPNIYGGIVCRLLKIPYIANITGLGTAVENAGTLQKLTVWLYKIALKKVNCAFFQNSENMEFFAEKKIALGKHRLIPGSGVNLEHFCVLNYPPYNTLEFVFISRIMKEKGIDQYLEAAEYIRNKHPNTRFHICGFCEEEYENKLKEIQNKDIIIYHGVVSDVREILKIVHCTVHPTYYPEGLSNVLLESSACGRPVITTDRAGCKEVIDDGVNGYIVKQKDSQDLIEKIERFIELDYEIKKQMGLAGRKKVEQSYDRNIVINEYMKEIELIKNK